MIDREQALVDLATLADPRAPATEAYGRLRRLIGRVFPYNEETENDISASRARTCVHLLDSRRGDELQPKVDLLHYIDISEAAIAALKTANARLEYMNICRCGSDCQCPGRVHEGRVHEGRPSR